MFAGFDVFGGCAGSIHNQQYRIQFARQTDHIVGDQGWRHVADHEIGIQLHIQCIKGLQAIVGLQQFRRIRDRRSVQPQGKVLAHPQEQRLHRLGAFQKFAQFPGGVQP